MGSIYKITNTANGKSYIGQTIQDAVKTRIRYHFAGRGNQLVKRAIEKYGQDAFTYEILHDGIIPEFLDDLEKEVIAKFNTVLLHTAIILLKVVTEVLIVRKPVVKSLKLIKVKNFLKNTVVKSLKLIKAKNTTSLADPIQKNLNKKCLKLIKVISHGIKANPFLRNTDGNMLRYIKAEKHSEESKQKMSEAHKSHIPWNKGKKGKPLSEEARRKISESLKGQSIF